MNRAFLEHIKRKTFLLDGVWEFKADKNEVGEKEEWFKHFPTEDVMEVAVPSCVNTRIGMMEFNSIAWYKKSFYSDGGNIEITFGSVSEYAKVYLDGKYLGDHYGGFTSFSFKANVDAGVHTLVLRVDPRPTEDTIPLYNVDWYHYCGIMRSVEVSCLSDITIERAFFKYDLSEDLKNALLHIDTKLSNITGKASTCTLIISLDDKVLHTGRYEVTDTLELTIDAKIDNVRLWDVGNGELYTLKVETETDDLIDRVGFRKIETHGKEILLNGKRVIMKGVNRHEDHPDWGFALPINLMQRDMDILKDLGVNSVRGSHYPNNKYFIDMCDSKGILFWSEIPMWGFHEEDLLRPLVIERGITMHKEMVEQYFNHPSIVIWGLHNECATDTDAGVNITKAFSETIKSLDTSRLLTFATNRALKDICFPYVDFISINQYTGWYEGEIEEWDNWVLEMKKRLCEIGMDSKPVLFSEFGVGAMFGVKTFDGLRWTENYQERYYDYTLNLFLGDEDLSGVYLWQYCDIRSDAKRAMTRVRSFNNKGIVNEHREPKLAYYKTKEIFHKYN